MPVASYLRILLARLNRERAAQGRPPLGLRRLAEESGVSLSTLAALHAGHSRRVDFATLDRLLTYFSRFFPVTIDDVLAWEPAPEDTQTVAVG